MDLDLDIDIRTSGRAARPIAAVFERELVEADLALLQTERGIQAPTIARIRESHHRIAQAFAEGLKPYEVAIRTGYSQSRISILRADPAIQDLISTYIEDNRKLATEVTDTLNSLTVDAIQILHERLVEREGTDSELADDTLMKLVEKTLDRTGHGPQSKTTNVNVNMNLGPRLDAARQRAGLIEGEVNSFGTRSGIDSATDSASDEPIP